MADVVRLDLARKADFDRWQAYVLEHPHAHYADLGQWRRLFAAVYGLRSVELAYVDGDRTRGAASLYLIASPFFGRLLVTCPFFGSGGFYAEDEAVEQKLFQGIDEVAAELDVDFVELRLRRPLPTPWVVQQQFSEYELVLGDSAEAAWIEALSSNARQNVRRSRKEPLTFSTTRDPSGAYELLSTTVRDLGTPFHSRRLFDLLPDYLGSHVLFSQVHRQGRLVAAGVLVRFRDRLATPFIGSLKQFGGTRANYLQYWSIIEHCMAQGIRRCDLGRSPHGTTVARFKQKWGAEPVALHYGHRVYSGRRTYRTVLEPSRLESLVSATWKHLPLGLTRRLGPLVARYIP